MNDHSPHNLSALMRHSDWVRALARTLVRDPHRAEDLAQEALVVALEHPPGHAQNLRGWFSRVLRNLHRQGGRRSQWFEAATPGQESEGASVAAYEVVARAEAQHLVAEEVLALDEPYRATLLLRYFDEFSVREIADQLSVSVATVTSRLTRAHALLRDRLDRRSGSDGRTWMTALLPVIAPRGPVTTAATGALFMSLQSKAVLTLAAVLIGLVAVNSFTSEELSPETLFSAGKSPANDLPASVLSLVQAPDVRQELDVQAAPAAQAEVAKTPAIEGQVFMPDGAPAAAAAVVLGEIRDLRFLDLGEEAPDSLVWTETDENGHFAFFDLPSGSVRLAAGSTSSAPSEMHLAELTKESPLTGIRLQLREGIRIYGDVIRKDGSIARKRKVRLLKEAAGAETHGFRLMRNIVTDDQGRFDEAHLCPGAWGLVTFASDEELVELGGSMPEHMIQATVELEDGQEQFIVLGASSSEAVTVRGQITGADGPVKGMMQWIGECEDPMGSQVIAQADESGHYEIELPQAGTWYVRVIASMAHTEHYIDLSSDKEQEIDFAIPAGSVSGYVLDEEGNPVKGAQISHLIHEGLPNRLGLSVGMDLAKSKSDGSFKFKAMDPGTYQIGVVHRTSGVSEVTTLTVEADQQIEDLELFLEAGEHLQGRVIGTDGAPIGGAPLWIRDSSGSVINPFTKMHSGKDGQFKSPPLPAGKYSILCQVGVLVGNVNHLRPGSEGSKTIEINLVEGAAVQVRATAGDEVLRPQVRITDLDGRLFSGVRNSSDPWEWKRYPFDSSARWVGPLPAGEYQVHVHVPGRGTRTQKVTLHAGEKKELVASF